jgi:hypothetical protein
MSQRETAAGPEVLRGPGAGGTAVACNRTTGVRRLAIASGLTPYRAMMSSSARRLTSVASMDGQGSLYTVACRAVRRNASRASIPRNETK